MAIKPLNPHYSFENHASIYDEEAMTALELAGKQGAKINEVVNAQNQLQQETAEHLEQQDQLIDERLVAQDKAIPVSVDATMKQRINDGTFAQEIDQYAGGLKQQVNNLLSSVPEGGTAMDAEVIDGRMDSAGTVYGNIGSAIRQQVENAENHSLRFFNVNRLNPDTVTPGYIDPTTGAMQSSDAYYTTDYIRIMPGEAIRCYDKELTSRAIRFVCAYDIHKELIPYDGLFQDVYKYTQDGEVAYIRCSIRIAEGSPLMISGEGTTDFALYNNGSLSYDALPEAVGTLPEKLVYHNYMNANTVTLDAYIAHDTGYSYPSTSLFATDYIPVTPGQSLSVFDQDMNKVRVRMYCWYDSNKAVIPGGEYGFNMVAPASASFVRMSIGNDYLSQAIITDSGCYKYLKDDIVVVRSECLPVTTNPKYNASQAKMDVMTGVLALNEFPRYTKKNTVLSFYADFDSFAEFQVGRGPEAYASLYLKVTATSIQLYEYLTEHVLLATHNHGLTMRNFVNVIMDLDDKGMLKVTLSSRTGTFSFEHDAEFSWCGYPYASTTGTLKNAVLTGACNDLNKPLWVFGDSYLGYSNQRVMGWVKEFGYNNFMVCAQPGLASYGALEDFHRCLNFGTPKTLVWYLGMNDNYAGFQSVLTTLAAECREKGITLIVNRVPSVPNYLKEDFFTLIQSLGLRYIDSYGVVDADSNGVWRDAFLSGDNVHPTELGARALAVRMLVDAPELMSYGRES